MQDAGGVLKMYITKMTALITLALAAGTASPPLQELQKGVQ